MTPEPVPTTARARTTKLAVVLSVWLLLAAASVFLATQNLSAPGLYYDEAVFAGLAKDFVVGQHRLHTPGFELANLFGRPFPLFVQFYLGALKSWILIPTLALFGSNLAVVRLTTLFCALLALLFFMLGVRRWLGLRAAMIAGVMLMADPAYFFLSFLDWGGAIPALFCRCIAFYLGLVWWQTRKPIALFLASFFLGLGVFNKFDLVVFLAGTAVAAACFYGKQLWTALRSRLSLAVIFVIGFLSGAGAMILKIPRIIRYSASGQGATGPGELKEKLHTLLAMYDGSYFYRLMNIGGLFQKMYDEPAGVHSLFGFGLFVAIIFLLTIYFRAGDDHRRRIAGFLLLGWTLTTIGLIALPGAVRIHHTILAFPFPQLIIASAFCFIWEPDLRIAFHRVVRALTLLIVFLLFSSQLRAIAKTERLIQESGGRGRWSSAFDVFCYENRNRADLTIISLDWGFNEQLAFLTSSPQLVEPVWALAQRAELPPLPRLPENVYLVHAPEYSLFRFDLAYLDAARASGDAAIRAYPDREGHIAFYTIRFHAP